MKASLTLIPFIFLFILQLPTSVAAQDVQEVLAKWDKNHPDLVKRLPNGRFYLRNARSSTTPPQMEAQLQEAFYREYADICHLYGKRYLLDWRTLLAKAARETYWGSSLLCNSAQNFFGIRMANKEWICENFRYCEVIEYKDPELTYFSVFPDFAASLWMFIHTICSYHYLERLPDQGERIKSAISFERQNGAHYWEEVPGAYFRALVLPGACYTDEQIIATWSGYEINNLCVACDRQSDHEWIGRILAVADRVGELEFSAVRGSFSRGF